MTHMHMVGALNNALKQAMKKDNKIVILGEDVGVDGGVFRVTDGLINLYGKGRVIDTPLAEAGIVGGSIGMAINGLKPICEIQFSGFSYQAFYHIKQHMARFRQRSNGTFKVPMVLRAPCSGGIRALEHHSESPEAFFVHCQGLKVVMPSGPYDAKGLLLSAIDDPDPVIFLEPKKIYRSFKEEVPEEEYKIPIGKANIKRKGKNITLITWGAMVKLCMEASEKLMEEGIDIEIIDLRSLWPMDTETVIESVKKTGKAIVVHEATRAGGLAGEIIARIQEEAILHLESPIGRVTSFDLPFPQFALEKYYLPDLNRIIKGIKKVVEF